MTETPKKNPAARSLGRRRAKVLGKEEMSRIGKLGGRPKFPDRCACGKYTKHTAQVRGHVCPKVSV